MFSTSISYFVCLLDILPGSGVNCSLVLEQQEPRRTTTAVRDGRRQQQLIGVVGGHGRRGTGACSALLYLLPCHAMVFLWTHYALACWNGSIESIVCSLFIWIVSRLLRSSDPPPVFIFSMPLFVHMFFSAWIFLLIDPSCLEILEPEEKLFFFTAAAVSLCVAAGCNVDRLRLVSEHLKH